MDSVQTEIMMEMRGLSKASYGIVKYAPTPFHVHTDLNLRRSCGGLDYNYTCGTKRLPKIQHCTASPCHTTVVPRASTAKENEAAAQQRAVSAAYIKCDQARSLQSDSASKCKASQATPSGPCCVTLCDMQIV
eukprot:1037877-Pleurochrysis_carterae.AAC.4